MRFSIVIPVFNAANYLNRCMDSILRQTYSDFEIILIDDGSSDESPSICDKYASSDNRIKAIHKLNEGANSARNLGALNARGEYVFLFDADDEINENLLSVVNDAIETSPIEPDIILYNFRAIYSDHTKDFDFDLEAGFYNKESLIQKVYPRLINKNPNVYYESLFPQAPWNRAYKRELLLGHICRDTRIKVANDCAFTYECVLYANSMVVCKDVLYYYHAYTENSLQRTYHPDIYENYAILFSYLEERIAHLHPSLPEQLNALYYYHLRKSMIGDLKHFESVAKASSHLREGLKKSGMLKFIHTKWLPKPKRFRVYLLRLHQYRIAMMLQYKRM